MKSHKRTDSSYPEGADRSEISTGLRLKTTQPLVCHTEDSDTGHVPVSCHLLKPVNKSESASLCHIVYLIRFCLQTRICCLKKWQTVYLYCNLAPFFYCFIHPFFQCTQQRNYWYLETLQYCCTGVWQNKKSDNLTELKEAKGSGSFIWK